MRSITAFLEQRLKDLRDRGREKRSAEGESEKTGNEVPREKEEEEGGRGGRAMEEETKREGRETRRRDEEGESFQDPSLHRLRSPPAVALTGSSFSHIQDLSKAVNSELQWLLKADADTFQKRLHHLVAEPDERGGISLGSPRKSPPEVASDYTKKKNVVRLHLASGSEFLFQADTSQDMNLWLGAFASAAAMKPDPSTGEGFASGADETGEGQGNERASPPPPGATKSLHRKLASLRNRSPSGQPPAPKSRKAVQIPGAGGNVPELASPKSKTWRGRVARHLKKMHPSQGSQSQSQSQTPVSFPEGATIGVPLELCSMSPRNECVPAVVEFCTSIVELKGGNAVGLYRVPGNSAAVASLTEAVNRGFENLDIQQDPRWTDVNVISSLLKSFFRRLPEPVVTAELYPSFIAACKLEDIRERYITIKKLLRELPEVNYETLRHLSLHLQRVSGNQATNKMDPRNLAIVFGPNLIRPMEEDMVTMVNDMSQQCKIVETLVLHANWFFDDAEEVTLDGLPKDAVERKEELDSPSATPNHSLLLNNLSKIEELTTPSDVCAKDVVSSIITAANRKSKTSVGTRIITHVPSGPIKVIPRSQMEKMEEAVMDMTAPAAAKPAEKEEKRDPKDADPWRYSEVTARTHERVRRFEEETRAMLEHAPRPSLGLSRQKVEEEWAKAKRDLETDDDLDELADRPSGECDSRRCLPTVLPRYRFDPTRSRSAVDLKKMGESRRQSFGGFLRPTAYHGMTPARASFPPAVGTLPEMSLHQHVMLRRGNSAEGITHPRLPTTHFFDASKMFAHETLRRARSLRSQGSREKPPSLSSHHPPGDAFSHHHHQVVPLASNGNVRCGSLDSLREAYDKDKLPDTKEEAFNVPMLELTREGHLYLKTVIIDGKLDGPTFSHIQHLFKAVPSELQRILKADADTFQKRLHRLGRVLVIDPGSMSMPSSERTCYTSKKKEESDPRSAPLQSSLDQFQMGALCTVISPAV
ncbi:unnamed protein product [Darwinula stevensoni]|uniref:Rho-GAP domain-containing protein n=1 Tax=Darwinula stevensoni TaxID=69355 RepID=A0A7R9AET3_9CRUS|nr:unnamed protein product [Darwinula stevensoni]CAG0902219.1 unnamed protein product [Darwinula stevensoni]